MNHPYVPCATCCTCTTPEILATTISASKTKCGIPFRGSPSPCPNELFLYISIAETGPPHGPCSPETLSCDGITGTWASAPGAGSVGSISVDPTTCVITYDLSGGVDCRTEYYSSPYTTSALVSNTIAALPSFSSFTAGSPVASYSLSGTEQSFTIERSKYKFRFKVPKVGNGSCYKLTWVERTSLTGGSPTDAAKSYTWDGVIPAGYDPLDNSTWPTTGEYEIDEPASNGETVIGYYTDPTDPTTFSGGYILAECRGCS